MLDKRSGLALVTGGAGFIGCNLAAHYLSRGWSVRVFDNLSRPGTEKNLSWLKSIAEGRLEVAIADVREYGELRRAACDADVIFHMASQVGVTTSVIDPRFDFEVNALGTLNMLEAARESGRLPAVVFASTNKVYGSMAKAEVELAKGGYRYRDLPMGVSEEWPLDFHSPYGCSKGAADQYVRDYARIYGLPTVVFRQSCIYGPHQLGNEDQGWVCHFAISALRGLPITLFGDGYQVRDVLYVDDLVAAYDLAVANLGSTGGKVYNLGGGLANAISLRTLLRMLREEVGRPLEVSFDDWRPGDQRVYISDGRRARAELGWEPLVGARRGIALLLDWLRGNWSPLAKVETREELAVR